MRIHGRQMYLYSGGNFSELTPIGCSTECALNISIETIELCHRGGVGRSRPGRKSWSVSARGFVADGGSFLEMSQIVGQPLSVAISVLRADLLRLGGVNLSAITPDEEVTLVGCVIISSANLGGSRGALATRDLSFVGDGELGVLVERRGFPYILPIIL